MEREYFPPRIGFGLNVFMKACQRSRCHVFPKVGKCFDLMSDKLIRPRRPIVNSMKYFRYVVLYNKKMPLVLIHYDLVYSFIFAVLRVHCVVVVRSDLYKNSGPAMPYKMTTILCCE